MKDQIGECGCSSQSNLPPVWARLAKCWLCPECAGRVPERDPGVVATPEERLAWARETMSARQTKGLDDLPPHDPEHDARRQADARAILDLRTLDLWASQYACREVMLDHSGFGADREWFMVLDDDRGDNVEFHGTSPDDVRAKAAAWVRRDH